MTILSFLIPVRHPDNARDWRNIKRQLGQTVRSIAAQDHPSWRGIVVANHGADLPALPPGFSVTRVDFPPNPIRHPDTRDSVIASWPGTRLDKGRRVLAGLLAAAPTRYVMVVDDDDFVHRGLTAFVAANLGSNGWYFDAGYLWTDGGSWLYECAEFHLNCGTSHIVRHDLYAVPASLAAADVDYLSYTLGGHYFLRRNFAAAGTPLEPLPFPGAIYRVGHGESWGCSHSVFRRFFWRRHLLKSPLALLGRLARLRRKTAAIEATYFGGTGRRDAAPGR